MKTALIIGCGYLGRRAGKLLAQRGWSVQGTVRSEQSASQLQHWNVQPILLDVLDAQRTEFLPAADAVLHCVGFDRSANASMSEVYVNGLHNVLHSLQNRVRRFCYISSTGVYGQQDGSWVDELSEALPLSSSGKVCRQAEQLLESFAREHSLDAAILRMAGLYGPGRVPRLDTLKRGEPIPSEPGHWLNLIEIGDAAAAAVAAIETPALPNTLYNVVDDQPIPRRDFYQELARLLGAQPPRFQPSRPPDFFSRDLANKRVSNKRLRADLALTWTYPNYQAGLRHILSND